MRTRRATLTALSLLFTAIATPLTGTAHAAEAPTARWPGHQPGKVVLGMSCGAVCAEKERELGSPYGVHRQFSAWGNWTDVVQSIRGDHADRRIPWVSVKGPSGGPSGWRAVAEGSYDDQIRQLATNLKANDDRPVILTFHHEPSNDGSEAEGRLWAEANNHFKDVLEQNGALENVAFAPIVGDWLFNPRNRGQDPSNWVQRGVLERADFLGIDLYENGSGETFAQRLPRILSYMSDMGFPDKMVGIGETGATDARYDKLSAVEFIDESLGWAAANTDKIGVVSYFNSTANSRAGVYWPLDETLRKQLLFQEWLEVSGLPSLPSVP